MFGSRNFLFAKGGSGAAQFKLFMWGENQHGNLGLGDTVDRSSPTQVGALTDWGTLVSNYHTLCTKSNGQLWAWGRGSTGALGQSDVINRSSPVQVGALTNWASPSAGISLSLCVKTDGTLWSWGVNTQGQLGLGNATSYSSPKQIGSSTNWSKVISSFRFVLATETTGKLFAWGYNGFGQLGLGDTVDRSSPTQVGALTNWSKPANSNKHSLCVKTDGTLWGWGYNTTGQLGQSDVIDRSSPVQVGALTNWASPTTGSYSIFSVCAKTDGTLWSWGSGSHGALGLSINTSYSSPKQIGTLTNWATPVASGSAVNCVKTDATLWAWGQGTYGSLGLNDTANRSSPVQIGTLTNWVQPSRTYGFAAGCIQGVATSAPISLTVPVVSGTAQDGQTLSSTTGTWDQFPASFAFQWQRGTSNIGGATSSTYLVDAADVGSTLRCVVTATNSIGATAANSANTAIVIAYVGKLFSWGLNIQSGLYPQGTLGLNDVINRSSPVQVGAETAWKLIHSPKAVAAIKTNGQLWQWGSGSFGQLGQNNESYLSSPVQVGALTTWYKPGGSKVSTLCTKTDGTLWVWGRGAAGQLGLNNTDDCSSPVQVGVLTDWNAPSTGSSYGSLCTKTDGTLWAWGDNGNGKLGLNDTANRSSPVQVGVLTNWSKVIVSSQSTLCTKTDGTLWSWGSNNKGQLGLNDLINRSSPVQVGALTNWAVPSSGGYSADSGWTVCTKTDGTLWSWGLNQDGRLGLGNTKNYSSPKQVGTLTNWRIAQAGYESCTSTKTDGTLWSWGRGGGPTAAADCGTLGLNVPLGTKYSSPKQVGALTTWLVPSLQYKSVLCTQR